MSEGYESVGSLCIIKNKEYIEPALYVAEDQRYYCLSDEGTGIIGDFFCEDSEDLEVIFKTRSIRELTNKLEELVGSSEHVKRF